MTATGVILLALPRLARDLMAELVREQPDLRLLGTVGDIDEARRLAGDGGGRVMIIAGDGVTDDDVAAALFALPHLRVVVFDREVRSGRLCQLEARCRALGGTSSAAVLAAIRSPGWPAEPFR